MPSLERRPPPGRPPPHAEHETALRDAAARLDAALGGTQIRDPALLSSVLRGDPVRDDLRAILARLDPERVLPLLHRLAAPDLPERREVLDGLLAGDPSGSGQALRATLQALHRRALLARIFHPDRVQALRRACRPSVQEAA